MSFRNVSPSSFIGGTWVQMNNTFLYAATSDVRMSNTSRYGEEKHTLTINEMPQHDHELDNWYSVSRASGSNASVPWPGSGSSKLSGLYTTSSGNGAAHNNMPPYTKVYMWYRSA